jgi:hypothetical protein
MSQAEYERARERAARSGADPDYVWACEIVGTEIAGLSSLDEGRRRGRLAEHLPNNNTMR